MLTIRDGRGRVLARLEKDGDEPRDPKSGTVLARRAGKDSDLRSLAVFAGRRLASLQLDLAPGDVLQPGTEADYGIPRRMEYLADEVSPVTYIKHDRGFYITEKVTDGIKIVDGQINLTGDVAEVQPGFTSTSFVTSGYALAAKLSARLLGNADFDLRKRTVRYLVDTIRRHREWRVATKVTTQANWAAGNLVPVSLGAWNGPASGAPLTDLFAALKASYLPADTLVLPESAAPFFHYSGSSGGGGAGPQIRDFVQGGGQLPRILYARAKQLAANAPSYIWSQVSAGSIALIRTTVHDAYWQNHRWNTGKDPAEIEPEWEPNDTITDIGTTHTLRWLGEHPSDKDAMRAYGVLVREYDDERELDTKWIVVAVNDFDFLPSNQVGALITGAIA